MSKVKKIIIITKITKIEGNKMKGIISNRLTKTIAVICIAAMMQYWSGGILSADLSTTNLPNIDAPELKYLIDSGSKDYLLIDLRDRPNFDKGHIPTAISIPHNEIEKHLFEIPKDILIILYCKAGKKAAVASVKLKEFDYEKIVTFGTDYWPYDLEDHTGKVYPSQVVREGCGTCGGSSSASNLLTFGVNTNLRDVIVQKVETSDKVKLDLFVMSQCPFAVKAEKAIAPIFEEFGEQIDFKMYFIARETPDGGFRSLHGQPEVEEDIRQVVMAKYYPNKYFYYVVTRAGDYQSDEWEPHAIDLGMDVKRVKKIACSAEGERLFRENLKKASELGISASPTVLIDDERYGGTILTVFRPQMAKFNGVRSSSGFGCCDFPPNYTTECVPNVTEADCNDFKGDWHEGWYCCPAGQGFPNENRCYSVGNYDPGCCDISAGCVEGEYDGWCRDCAVGSWHSNWHCCMDDGNCHECCNYSHCGSSQVCCNYTCYTGECCTDDDCEALYGAPDQGCWHECNNHSCDLNLPVELSSFTANFLYNKPTLYWATQSETDNLGWNIYRAQNDDNFVNAAQINNEMITGYGTTSQPHYYIYEDEIEDAMPEDVYWYWLESIDLGGEVHHYNSVRLQIPDGFEDPTQLTPPILYELQNFPNPFKGSTTISFTLSEAALAEISIYNIHGELIKTLPIIVASTNEKATLYWDGKDKVGIEQSSGIYLYQLKLNGKVFSNKLLILIR